MARMPIYWFLDGKPYKRLHIDVSNDIITAWSYSQHKRVGFTYSDVRRRHEKAFTTTEVCKILNRVKSTVFQAFLDGKVEKPFLAYALDENRKPSKYLWQEKDIIDLHTYFRSVHRGKARKDGLITHQAMPNIRELRAILRNEEIMYVKQGDKFLPVWQAKEF